MVTMKHLATVLIINSSFKSNEGQSKNWRIREFNIMDIKWYFLAIGYFYRILN